MVSLIALLASAQSTSRFCHGCLRAIRVGKPARIDSVRDWRGVRDTVRCDLTEVGLAMLAFTGVLFLLLAF